MILNAPITQIILICFSRRREDYKSISSSSSSIVNNCTKVCMVVAKYGRITCSNTSCNLLFFHAINKRRVQGCPLAHWVSVFIYRMDGVKILIFTAACVKTVARMKH